MTHHLSRCQNRWFPTNSPPPLPWPARRYEDDEHLGEGPTNILEITLIGIPLALTLQGTSGDSTSEKVEIFDHILDQRWNLP